MVDRRGQLVEELLEPVEVGGVEGRRAPRAELGRGALEALGVAAGEDDVGALGAGAPGGLEADAGAAADHDDGLSERAASPRSRRARLRHDSDLAAAISARSAFSASA